jgi:glycosyltransferase involved in cell wall biosynthesis/2-polyprenyl-3-methyl-5-hydroxy-6-metoxy-1,4-benzoquinol methylase
MSFSLQDSGYVFEQDKKIWLEEHYAGINYSDGDEIELRIAGIIDQVSDRTVLSTELRQHGIDWASVYHLSGSRANILRPFQSLLTGDILEIGAGCGAITRYLGECGANVLALEGSLRRAAIARVRTADLENVTVLAERFEDFKCDFRFDVITLIGVLEYANLFTSGDNPHLVMLERVRSLLKPDGKLIIAIENQLGLKYFAGALEDHVGQAMYSIEGRYHKDQPQTFGRKVLAEMLGQSGFAATDFFAPFPDYKLPFSIVTEAGLVAHDFDAAAFAWQSVTRDRQLPGYCHFSQELAWPEIFKNGLALDLANSFLILASSGEGPAREKNVLAYHYSTERVPRYCKETLFVRGDSGIDVAYRQLATIGEDGKKNDEAGVIGYYCPPSVPYSRGKTLAWEFVKIVTRDGWTIEEVGQFVKKYVVLLEMLADQAGKPVSLSKSGVLLPGMFFDLVPQNIIIRADGSPEAIDTEWRLNREMSLGFLLLRAMWTLQAAVSQFGHNATGQRLTRLDLMKGAVSAAGFVLTEQDLAKYIEVESLVQEQVSGLSIQMSFADLLLNLLPVHDLSQVLAERDKQIAMFHKGLAERDKQIVERDKLIPILYHAIAERNEQISSLSVFKDEVLASTSWRMTKPLRVLIRQLKRGKDGAKFIVPDVSSTGDTKSMLHQLKRIYHYAGLAGIRYGFSIVRTKGQAVSSMETGYNDINEYAKWIQTYDTITDETRIMMKECADDFLHKPLISVLLPTYNTSMEWLIQAIESVRQQIYPHWELCIADDASTNLIVRAILTRYAKRDSRIKIVLRTQNGHISAASNSALGLASGEWLALLDHDDLLSEQALFWMADAINKNPGLQLIYSDEDKIDAFGRRFDPYFKCDWNIDLFYSQNLITHLGGYRTDLVKKVGGFRLGLEGAQDYDLALRCIERLEPEQICHIPRVLYHWRMHAESTSQAATAKPYAMIAGEKALNEHLQRKKINARAELVGYGYRVHYTLPDVLPMVSLIIPTRNGFQFIRPCVESILNLTTYPNYEILIVDNDSDDPQLLHYFDELQKDARVRVVRVEQPFNYSALNNAAVKLARGEIVGLLNNDLEVITPEWLTEMVSIAVQPAVGAVGAKLWYPDDTLQHGGIILGLGGWAGHAHKGFPKGHLGHVGRMSLISGFTAVTGACLLVRKSVYEQVGGLNEVELQVSCNDVDFCLRLREAGYRNVWTPYAELYHHESATRGYEVTPEKKARFAAEVQYVKQNREDLFLHDPAYSPNLTLDREDFSLAWPPRIT